MLLPTKESPDLCRIASEVLRVMANSKDRLMPNSKNRLMPNWWNENISEEREITIRCRRKLQRARAASRDPIVIQELVENYKTARRKLKKAIKNAKHEAWKKIIIELTDVWETLLRNRLQLHLEERRLLHHEQYGFGRRRYTI